MHCTSWFFAFYTKQKINLTWPNKLGILVIYSNSSYWEKLLFPSKSKNLYPGQFLASSNSCRYQWILTSFGNLKITDLKKKHLRLFSVSVSILRYYILNKSCILFLHVKKHYWIYLMTEKGFQNFLKCIPPLKKLIVLIKLELPKVQTRQKFDIYLENTC